MNKLKSIFLAVILVSGAFVPAFAFSKEDIGRPPSFFDDIKVTEDLRNPVKAEPISDPTPLIGGTKRDPEAEKKADAELEKDSDAQLGGECGDGITDLFSNIKKEQTITRLILQLELEINTLELVIDEQIQVEGKSAVLLQGVLEQLRTLKTQLEEVRKKLLEKISKGKQELKELLRLGKCD